MDKLNDFIKTLSWFRIVCMIITGWPIGLFIGFYKQYLQENDLPTK